MPSNREIVTATFAAWTNGTRYGTSIFADDIAFNEPWQVEAVTGGSAASAMTSA